jgi:hydrogenase-4 component F
MILRAGFASTQSWAAVAMLILLIVIFIGFLNHFSHMYFEGKPEQPASGPRINAWGVLPMWLALIPLLVLGVWWPSSLMQLFGDVARGLGVTP